MPPDDASLVRSAQAGDRAALDQLLRRHLPRIQAVCRRLLVNEADAADASQEALIAIVRGLDRFDGRSAFGTWAYRVATNAALDELRRRRRRPVVERDDTPREHVDPRGDTGFDTVSERDALLPALAQLSDEFREAVVLRDVADLDYAEIGEILGIPPGTVRSRIARGRSQLATLLGNQAPPPDRQTSDHD